MNNNPTPNSPPQWPAFTLVELLVVVAMLGLFSLCLVPALCGSKSQTKVTACAANFRQWAVSANMYAKDSRDLLPSWNWAGGGGAYIWDVATNMVTSLGPYGLTIPMWYDPVRPGEYDGDRTKFQQTFGRPMSSIADLQMLLNQNAYNECVIHQNWWVQRSQSEGASVFPTDLTGRIKPTWAQGTPAAMYGWPKTVYDRAAAHVPFVSDECGSGSGSSLAASPQGVGYAPGNISPNTAHFFGGRLNGVNAAYVDGHVEMHNPAAINCGYDPGNKGTAIWFY